MPNHCLKVARGLLNQGRLNGDRLRRKSLLADLEVPDGTFRSAGETIGAKQGKAGLRFFDSSVDGRLAFGPGAGLVVGVSVGTESLRAAVVDANGWIRADQECAPMSGQLTAHRGVVLGRIREAVGAVLAKAYTKPELLVERALPLLGVAVAWPAPVDRRRRAVGHALAHASWGGGQPLDGHVRQTLGIKNLKASFALNDAHAAAIGEAHRVTHSRGYESWDFPRLTIVLRLAGAIGGAVIVIEPPEDRRRGRPTEQRRRAGFQDSILLAGFDNHAGELGHVPIDPAFVTELNRGRPRGLRKLEARHCTCTPEREPVPDHVEAYASAMSLAARLDPRRPMHEVMVDVLRNPGTKVNARALSDAGALVAQALVAPVAVLNPARVALTGSMAIEPVRAEIETRLQREHRFGDMPEVDAIPEPENRYIRAQGAALALLRIHVHRELHTLLPDDKAAMTDQIEGLTTRIDDAAIQRLSRMR